MKLIKLFFLIIVFNLALTTSVFAMPSMLHNVPTTDTVAHDNFSLLISYYKYDDANKSCSGVYGIEYGYKKLELGIDLVGGSSFTSNGYYAGRTTGNIKWRIMTEGSDEISLAVGSYYIGAKKYNDQYYKPSPYIVASKTFKDIRLHLGYQDNMFGAKEITYDKDVNQNDVYRRSKGIIAGIDAVIYKHPKNPITLMLDYTGGVNATYGIGFYQPINAKTSWFYSHYSPKDKKFPNGVQQDKQHFIGITYNFSAR